MAKNAPKGDGHRIGAVKQRSQVHNPQNNRWTKRGPDGKFMDQKTQIRGIHDTNTLAEP
jgi:hypothetical protein